MASKPVNRPEPFEINHNVSGEPLNINHSNAKSEETCQSHSLVVNEARKKSESTQYSASTISKPEKPKDKFGSNPSTLPANARVLPTNKKPNSHPQMVKKVGKNSESTEYPMCIISKHEKPKDTCPSNPSIISPGNTRAMATNAKTNSHPQMVNKAEKNSESTQYLMCSISKPEKPKGTIASDPSISSGNTRALQTNAKTNSHPQMVNKDGKNSESTEYLMCRISKPEKPEGTFASDPSISSGNTRTLPTNAETNNSHPQIVNKVGKNSESTEYLMYSISKPEKPEGTFASDPSISSGNTRALSTNTKTTSHSQMVNKDGKNSESAEYLMCSISKPEKPEGTFVSDSSISPGNTKVLLTNAKENRRPQMVNKDGKKFELNEYSMCTTSKLEKPKVTFTSDLSTSPRNTRVLPTNAKTNGHPQMVNKDGKLSETTEYSTCIISKPEKLKDTFASDPSTSPGNTKALPTNTKTNGHSQMVNKVGEMSESTEYSMSTISKPEKSKGIFASDPSTSPGNTRALLANAKTNSHLQIVHKTGKNFESIEDTFASNPSISPGNIRPTNAKANSYGQGCSNSSPSNSLDSIGPPIKPHTGGDARWDAIQMVSRGTPLNLSHFRVLKRIGRGDIGSVHLVELKRTKAYFAMKVMDKASLASRNKSLRAQAEREILQLLDHPFLPTLYAYLETDKYHCLVMEFCSGGDLHSLRQKQPNKYFTEEAARFYVSEILLAIEYLHMLGIVYRDLKPENVLVRDEGHIMLSDFDLSLRCSVSPTVVKSSHTNASNNGSGSIIEDDNAVQGVVQQQTFFPRILPLKKTRKSKSDFGQAPGGSLPELVAEPKNVRSMSFVGTHEYLAPEIIRNEGHGSAVDWWTFGIFLYELLHGATPFKGSGNRDTLINVIGQPLKFPEAPHVSSAAKDLIKKLLVKEPKKRIAYTRGATEIKQHPFFEGVNWALVRSALPPHVPEPVDFSQYASKEALSPKDKKMIEVVKDQNKHSADDSYIDFEYF